MVADKIRKEGLNVRQVEQLITRLNENNQKPKKRPEKKISSLLQRKQN